MLNLDVESLVYHYAGGDDCASGPVEGLLISTNPSLICCGAIRTVDLSIAYVYPRLGFVLG